MERPVLGLSRKEAVKAGREVAPKFDFPLLSKCLKPDVYGIKPIDEIEALIFASESRRIDKRRLAYKHTWRCDKRLESRLQIVKTQLGEKTFQGVLTLAALSFCEHYEQKRRNENA